MFANDVVVYDDDGVPLHELDGSIHEDGFNEDNRGKLTGNTHIHLFFSLFYTEKLSIDHSLTRKFYSIFLFGLKILSVYNNIIVKILFNCFVTCFIVEAIQVF